MLFCHASSAQPSRAEQPQLNRVLSRPDSELRAELPDHLPRWSERAANQLPLADDQPLHLTFVLSRSPERQSAFDQLLRDQQDPASPSFHQWLTPGQIGTNFGPTQHDLDALTAWFATQGLHLDLIEPSRLFVQVSGSAATVQAALKTTLHRYPQSRQAPAVAPSIPAALAPLVASVQGLTEVPLHTHSRLMAPISTHASNQAIHPNATLASSTHWLAPADFANLYSINPVYSTGITGTGQRIMIVGGSRLLPADLANWEKLVGVSLAPPTYIIGPNFIDPGFTSDDSQAEGTLDFERASSTAPGAAIDMVIAQNWLSAANSFNLISYAINTVNDPVLSLSFGSCEADQPAATIHAEDALYAQAAAQGISVFVSSGDSGVDSCQPQGLAPQPPLIASINDICATANVTCVGGTQFNDTASPSTWWSSNNGVGLLSALGPIPEGAWNEPNGTTATPFVLAATGGGASTIIAKPAWQTGAGVPADGARDVPDLAFSASGHNAYLSCLTFAGASCVADASGNLFFTGFGGTSAAAPSMAGIAALLDQKVGVRQGNLNPALYRFAASAPSAFHDATPLSSGVANCSTATPSLCNNSDPSATALTGGLAGYPLTIGFDLATGLGSLDVANLFAAQLNRLPPSVTTLTASPTTITTAQTAVFTASVAGATGSANPTPTGTVQFSSGLQALGAPVPLVHGVATSAPANFLIGHYTIQAAYQGDLSYDPSTAAPLAFTVTLAGSAASTTTLTVSPTPATTLTALSLTARVSGAAGTPTGSVQFVLDSQPYGAPVALQAGLVALAPAPLSLGNHLLAAKYSGDSVYAGSVSNATSLTVSPANQPTVTALSLAPLSVAPAGSITIQAKVSSALGNPTGSVALFNASTHAAAGSFTLINGVYSASIPVASLGLPIGVSNLYAVYSGDGLFASSTSPQVPLTVANAALALTPASATLSLAAGASATDTLTLGSTLFTGTASLACSILYNGSGTPANTPSCSLNPASATFTGSGTQSATLALTSASAHSSAQAQLQSRNLRPLGASIFAALLFAVLPRCRRSSRLARLLASLVLTGGLALIGCGSTSNVARALVPGTTAGLYTVNVTLNGGGGVTASTAIALTIQ